MEMEEKICKAIHEKKLLGFYYQGHYRIVEPHIYGISVGDRQLLGYQVAGKSANDKILSWRRFKLSEIHYLKVRSRKFAGARQSGEPKAWERYIAIVE
jgi:hypothetical protein